MRITPKWVDEAQKPLLFNLSDDQKKDTAVWTEAVGTGDSAGDAPMDGSSDNPPPPRMYFSTVSRHLKQVSFDTEAYFSMSMGHGHSGMA